MTTSLWVRWLETSELEDVGEWVDELADDPSQHPETIANTVIDDGVHAIPDELFDAIVEYVERRRARS